MLEKFLSSVEIFLLTFFLLVGVVIPNFRQVLFDFDKLKMLYNIFAVIILLKT